MKIKDIAAEIEKIAPPELAQDLDNVGLLIGDGKRNVRNILLTIDVTGEVVAEAKRLKADLIVSYHPVIWDGLKQVTPDGPGGVVYDLIRSGISVYSIHTALDSAIGGVNDGLAEIVGIVDGEPIGDYVENPASDNYKLVVFVPVKVVAKVSNAVFAAGGKVEKVPEIRFETVVPAEKLGEVIAAMKKVHPYERPAFDCYKLYDSQSKFGLGRIGKLAKPVQLNKIVEKIKKQTGAKAIGTIGRGKRLVKKAAVCAGSCGKIINSVIAERCDLYVTGELKHHYALAAQEAGLTCICLSHSVSERFILKKFAKQLQGRLKQVNIKISKKDADPFRWKEL